MSCRVMRGRGGAAGEMKLNCSWGAGGGGGGRGVYDAVAPRESVTVVTCALFSMRDGTRQGSARRHGGMAGLRKPGRGHELNRNPVWLNQQLGGGGGLRYFFFDVWKKKKFFLVPMPSRSSRLASPLKN